MTTVTAINFQVGFLTLNIACASTEVFKREREREYCL